MAYGDAPDLPPLPKVNPVVAAYAEPSTHRLLPLDVELAGWRLLNERDMRQSAVDREHVHRSMEYLLGKSRRASEVPDLARRYGMETKRRTTMLWRPWLVGRLPVRNAEVLRELDRAGRGVVVSFMHHGPFVSLFGSLKRIGLPTHAPVAAEYFKETPPGYSGRRNRAHLTLVRRDTLSAIPAVRGSGKQIRQLLAGGERVAVASDLPGSTPVDFLGRRVLMTDAAARHATASGAAIVPINMEHRGRSTTLVVGNPMEPVDYNGPEELLQAIVDAHAPAVLAWPEALEWPLRRSNPA